GRTDADAVGVVKRRGTYPKRLRVVVVRTVRKPRRPTRFVKGDLAWQPRLALKTMRHDRATRAMHVIVEVLIGLDLAKVGQQLLKAPLVVPHSRPRVVIFRHAP